MGAELPNSDGSLAIFAAIRKQAGPLNHPAFGIILPRQLSAIAFGLSH
jgi:hypothetical protein